MILYMYNLRLLVYAIKFLLVYFPILRIFKVTTLKNISICTLLLIIVIIIIIFNIELHILKFVIM